MQNGAYRLGVIAAALGLVLLMIANSGDGLYTPLGTALLGVAGFLAVLGKGIDLLGHVRDGATDSDEHP